MLTVQIGHWPEKSIQDKLILDRDILILSLIHEQDLYIPLPDVSLTHKEAYSRVKRFLFNST